MVGKTWGRNGLGFCLSLPWNSFMAVEFCYACLCGEALNIPLALQTLIQVEAVDLVHLWGFQRNFFFPSDKCNHSDYLA